MNSTTIHSNDSDDDTNEDEDNDAMATVNHVASSSLKPFSLLLHVTAHHSRP